MKIKCLNCGKTRVAGSDFCSNECEKEYFEAYEKGEI